MSKTESLARLDTAPIPDWFLQTAQQIQVIDYELHASIRIISRGKMTLEQVPAFMDACIRRDRLMARVISYLAEQRKQSAHQTAATRDGVA
ncbi:MAG: hypothetical protein JO166_04665 [Deltaproteobacteria bacterium]|nr:hypothetical protein [Deltaproteobacteria bacterium]